MCSLCGCHSGTRSYHEKKNVICPWLLCQRLKATLSFLWSFLSTYIISFCSLVVSSVFIILLPTLIYLKRKLCARVCTYVCVLGVSDKRWTAWMERCFCWWNIFNLVLLCSPVTVTEVRSFLCGAQTYLSSLSLSLCFSFSGSCQSLSSSHICSLPSLHLKVIHSLQFLHGLPLTEGHRG